MRLSLLLLSCTLLFSGCSSVYYGAMEKVGIPKRKILVDRVGAAAGQFPGHRTVEAPSPGVMLYH